MLICSAAAEMPEFAQRALFITGESFAGKYLPALAARILQGNAAHESSLQFQGMAVGDGLIDPISQRLAAKDQALGFGVIDTHQYGQLTTLAQHCKAEILTANYVSESCLSNDCPMNGLKRSFT